MTDVQTAEQQPGQLAKIAALREGSSIVIPEFYMGLVVDNFGQLRPIDVYRTAPSLAQLRHGYLSDEQVRQSLPLGKGELTSTYRLPRERKRSELLPEGYKPVTVVTRPSNVHFDSGKWIVEFDVRDSEDLQEPPDGWGLEYDNFTGYPLVTGEKGKAVDIFGDKASYAWFSDGVRSLWRWCNGDDGPFNVGAGWLPDGRDLDVGSRLVVQDSDSIGEKITPEQIENAFLERMRRDYAGLSLKVADERYRIFSQLLTK